MDNQHRKITGYRDLSQADIDNMNKVKATGAILHALVEDVRLALETHRKSVEGDTSAGVNELARLKIAEPERWASIARTHFQEGLMALTRAVAQPGSF